MLLFIEISQLNTTTRIGLSPPSNPLSLCVLGPNPCYNQVLNYLEKENQDDESLYKFRAITDHHGQLKKDDPHYNGSPCNVIVQWETGGISDEPISIIAKDDPVTCEAYAKEHSLLHLPEWNKLNHIVKDQ